jgi:hypothetical protein
MRADLLHRSTAAHPLASPTTTTGRFLWNFDSNSSAVISRHCTRSISHLEVVNNDDDEDDYDIFFGFRGMNTKNGTRGRRGLR